MLWTKNIPNFNERRSKLKLLYKATTDGWDYTDFNHRCDKKGPTIVIIKSSKGKLCGGFASSNWDIARTC